MSNETAFQIEMYRNVYNKYCQSVETDQSFNNRGCKIASEYSMPFSTIYSYLLSFCSTWLIAELNGHGGPVISLAISSNGRMLASGGRQQVSVHRNGTNTWT